MKTIEIGDDGDVSVVTAIREGDSHEGILTYVEDQGIDIVAKGSKGRSAFKTIFT